MDLGLRRQSQPQDLLYTMKFIRAKKYIEQKIKEGILNEDILEGLSKSEVIMVALFAMQEEVTKPYLWRK